MITRERVLELLDFDGKHLRWKITQPNKQRVKGEIAGSITKALPYRRIGLDGSKFYAHRLVWLIVHGQWPPEQIDHINGNYDDNRPENLRAVTNAENARNMRRNTRNTSGVTGVYWSNAKKRWIALITVNGKQKKLGHFIAKHHAIAARQKADALHGYHPNHGKR